MIGSRVNLLLPWLRLILFKTNCRRRNDLRSRLYPFTMCIYRIAERYTLIESALTERAMYVTKYTSIFSFVGRIWFGCRCSLKQKSIKRFSPDEYMHPSENER